MHQPMAGTCITKYCRALITYILLIYDYLLSQFAVDVMFVSTISHVAIALLIYKQFSNNTDTSKLSAIM